MRKVDILEHCLMARKRKQKKRSSAVPMPAGTKGIGSLVSSVGLTTATSLSASGQTVLKQVVQCSCGGENSNCFKCDGIGYYEREVRLQDGVLVDTRSSFAAARCRANAQEVGFSGDALGGSYGIREHGRFASPPTTNTDED